MKIETIAVLVSIASILVSLATAYRVENITKLSHSPFLVLHHRATTEGIGFGISNLGAGVAVVRSISVVYAGAEVEPDPNKPDHQFFEPFRRAVALRVLAMPEANHMVVGYMTEQHALRAGQDFQFYRSKESFATLSLDSKQRLLAGYKVFAENMKINVCYCSVFGDRCQLLAASIREPKKENVDSC